MHAAVWSQPVVCRKIHRCHSRAETPHSKVEKFIFGIGIGLTLLGGLLAVLGLTGYFGNYKYYVGFGGVVGIITIFSGLIAVRAVSRKSKARSCTLAFIFLSSITCASSITMVVLDSIVLHNRPDYLLPTILVVSQATTAALATAVSGVGFVTVVRFRLRLMYPDQNDEEIVDRDVPVLPQE